MKIDLQKHVAELELYEVPELCAKIIHSMQTDGSAFLYTKESKNPEINGLFTLLDELCAYWLWNKDKITISTSNPYVTHAYYRIDYIDYSHPLDMLSFTPSVHLSALNWNQTKNYGMFIGRASASRIWALQQHNIFRYKNTGLTSFHADLHQFMCLPEMAKYYMQSDQTYSEMQQWPTPYSDIAPVQQAPMTPDKDDPYLWQSVYEKIGIEIVCEVSAGNNQHDLSEKIARCMFYKRPFLLISSPGSLEFLKERGYKTFDHIIDENYDILDESKFARVNRVFTILDQLITTVGLTTLLEESKEILEYNRQQVIQEHIIMRNMDYKAIINKK